MPGNGKKIVRIATRRSKLALAQTRWVAAKLVESDPDIRVEEVQVTTKGDRFLDKPLALVGGKGLFVNELEVLLAENRADLAVHSVKDLPADLHPELELFAMPLREDARDVLVTKNGMVLDDLDAGSSIGTSSQRRELQIHLLRPDLAVRGLRGNVDTRLGKLEAGEFDAIVLAAAGLIRLGLDSDHAVRMSEDNFVPSPGQGAIAIQGRSSDLELKQVSKRLGDWVTEVRVASERKVSKILGGDCHVPLGVHARVTEGRLQIDAVLGSLDNFNFIRTCVDDKFPTNPTQALEVGLALGEKAAAKLIDNGAAKFLCNVTGPDVVN